MAHDEGSKFRPGRAPRATLERSCIPHERTPFLDRVQELGHSDPEWVREEAQRISQEVKSWHARIQQLIRSAHECGTAATAQEARERFNALNEERLEEFLQRKGSQTETLLWDGVYARLLLKDSGLDYLPMLFEGIRALDLLVIVATQKACDRPPSWYRHCDIPVSRPWNLRPQGWSRQEVVQPVSGIRALGSDDLSIVEKTLDAFERGVK